MMDFCKSERERKDDLEWELSDLQERLTNAPPQEKPGIVAMIRELNPRRDEAVRAYKECLRNAPTDFHPWPNGKIPYQIAVTGGDIPGFSSAMRTIILQGIGNWNNILGGSVQFVPKTREDRSFLNIFRATSGTANWTEHIGFHGGVHNMWLLDNQNIGRVHHELGHIIGLHHEHMRQDRDQHLNLFEGQIPRESYPDTWGQVVAKVRMDVGPYDLKSVMHYPSLWDRPNLRVTSSVRDNNGNFVRAIGGTIRKTSNFGRATHIVWDNGVILIRGEAEPSPPIGRSVFELSGTWQSNVGVEYFFAQVGRSFTWSAPAFGQSGEGSIEGPTATSGTTPVIIFEDKNGQPVTPNWSVITPQDAAGVIEIYDRA